jgi:hypothetical protein
MLTESGQLPKNVGKSFLIDKYINKKGGKLFACFVDFRRAFDTVIHEGIKYKLLKSGIGGNSIAKKCW